MAVPCGKGLYTLAPGAYPGGDPGAYAKAMGCEFVVAQGSINTAGSLQRLKAHGLKVYLFEFPGKWHPGNWERTLSDLVTTQAQLGLSGVVADIEDWPQWQGEPESTFRAVGAALGRVQAGFTSFPSWGSRGALRALAAAGNGAIWASPQIYGRGGENAAVLAQRLNTWRGMPWSGMVPSVWPDPAGAREGFVDRTPAEAAAYLKLFARERGIVIFQGSRAQPGTLDFAVLRQARVAGCRRWWKYPVAALVLGGAVYGGTQIVDRLR